jgi:post-segregation antitoxin (ccd killing protein)
MIHKTITIKDEHEEWIKKHSINLSRFVQNRINEILDKYE